MRQSKSMTHNEIKKAASLGSLKFRKKYRQFLVEGVHSVAELLKSEWQINSIIVASDAQDHPEIADLLNLSTNRKLQIHTVSGRIFDRIAATESPQGIVAVAATPARDMPGVIAQERILIADHIADPGNLGAMIRCAVAFGFRGIITTPGSADIFNPKTVRASQGALFWIKISEHATAEELSERVKPTHKIYALSPKNGADIGGISPASRFAIVIGAEAAGISPELLAISDSMLTIPMAGPTESLNAAVSASISMYELSRKR